MTIDNESVHENNDNQELESLNFYNEIHQVMYGALLHNKIEDHIEKLEATYGPDHEFTQEAKNLLAIQEAFLADGMKL